MDKEEAYLLLNQNLILALLKKDVPDEIREALDIAIKNLVQCDTV